MSFLKTTFFGGLLFLVPFGILLLVLQEVIGILTLVAAPLTSRFPPDDYVAIALSTLIVWGLLILICFTAGLAARHAAASGLSTKTDRFLAGIVPGYGMMRTRLAAVLNDEDLGAAQQVVTVEINGLKRWGFLIEESDKTGEALLFLPNSPNAETGTVGTVPIGAVTKVATPPHVLVKSFEFYGRDLLEGGVSPGDAADPKKPRTDRSTT